MPDATRLSCGVILLNERDQLLLAHATGSRWWDLPKGLAEPGESPLDAARRELLEETGIALDEHGWADLGRHRYRPRKDLHLFTRRVRTRDVRVQDCVCTTSFRDPRTGRMLPEADAFCWYEAADVADRCARSMKTLLQDNGLLARALAASGASVAP